MEKKLFLELQPWMWPDISMGICKKKFKIFDYIGFEIIAFE
jgi:hypothetical protein